MAIKISGNTVIDDSQNISVSGNATANSFVGDGSNLTNLPGGGNVTEDSASGTLSDGSKVIVNADGTVSVVAQTETTGPGVGTPIDFESGNTTIFQQQYMTLPIKSSYCIIMLNLMAATLVEQQL